MYQTTPGILDHTIGTDQILLEGGGVGDLV